MTSPSCPVRMSLPWPDILVASMKITSPPTSVQTSPVATPISSSFSASPKLNFAGPRYFPMVRMLTVVLPFLPSTTLRATWRQIAATLRSKFRTPASRV